MPEEGDDMIPAVVLSSHTIGLAVIRSLGMMGVPVYSLFYDVKDMGYASKYVVKKIKVPHPETEEDGFVQALMRVAGATGNAVLIPADDPTVSTVSKHNQVLEKFFRVACPDHDTVMKYIDKMYTYELAGNAGIPSPMTIVPKMRNDVSHYGKNVRYPCLVKPRKSHIYFDRFGRKMTLVKDLDEMLRAYDEAENEDIDVLIQEYIPGGDNLGVNYNCFLQEGRPIVEFTAAKVRLSPPGFGVPRVVVSRDIPEIREQGRKILEVLGYNGYSCTEFKRDPRDGVMKLMEVNGRHNRSALLAVRCGINFPWIEYRYLTTGEIDPAISFREGIYWIDEFRDVYHSLKYFTKEGISLFQYMKPYFGRHVFAVFDIRDTGPFLKRCRDMAGFARRNGQSSGLVKNGQENQGEKNEKRQYIS